MEHFYKRTFDQAVSLQPDISWCPTPDCKNVFVFEEGDNNFKCDVCHLDYCLNCKAPNHKGQSCAEYRINNGFDENDEKFMKFVQGKKYKTC